MDPRLREDDNLLGFFAFLNTAKAI